VTRRQYLEIALLFALGPTEAMAQQCQPTPGLFITTMLFHANATYTATPYAATQTATSIQVLQSGSVIYTHSIPSGYSSSYSFYGTGNRYFLTRDVRSTNTDETYSLGLVNLAATGSPTEYSLLNQTYFRSGTPDLNVQPSQGNGQAVFVFVGVSGQVGNLEIYCSENGVGICATSPFTPVGQVIGEATTTTVRIKEGGTIRAECILPVPPVSPSITTTANPAASIIGSTLKDAATLSGGNSPTGTIKFNLYQPSSATCSGTPSFTKSVTVSGNGTYGTSTGFAGNALGTWHWTASYSGDGNNNSTSTPCAAEPVTVGKASPSISTTPSPTSGAVGGMLNDQATLSAGYALTGTITFRLYQPNDPNCSAPPSFTNTVSVTGNGSYITSSGFASNSLGVWHWTAGYSGDGNNNATSSTCAAEPITVKASPLISTTPNPVTCIVCSTLNDAATLSGGNSPTGTITFKLYPPSDATCSGTPSYTNTVTVNGVGTYATSPGFVANRAGTWHWTTRYSGDGTNNVVNSACAAEPVSATGDSWTTRAPMPSPRRALGVGVVNKILYAIGGLSTSNAAVATVEAYNPVTNSWTSMAPMPTARYGLAVGVVNGIVYAVGGVTGGRASQVATIEAYDPVTNTWTTKAPMPTARAALAVGVVNGVLYAVGGVTRNGSTVATVEAYNPGMNTWTTKTPMPTARSQLAVGVSNGILFAIGGGTSSVVFSKVEAYNPPLNSWTTKTPMPTPRYQLAVGVPNGILYAVGGLNGTNATVATNEAYDPATNAWTTMAIMPTARANLSVGVIDCLLYAIDGGFSTKNEAYRP